MKRTLAGTLAVLTVAGAVPANTFVGNIFAKTAITAGAEGMLSGTGTWNDPYQINSTEDMKEYLNNDMYTKPDDDMAFINVSAKIDCDLAFGKNTYVTGELELTCLEPFIDIKEGTSVVFDCPVDAMFIYSYGELTIKDNVNCVVLDADTNGRLTIDSGEISSDFIYADNGGTLIVNGGDIGYGVYARKSAINGGTFSCSECRFVRSQIIGGTFSGDKCDFTNSYIKGGTFTGSDCIFVNTTIWGGTFNFDPSKNENIIIPNGCKVTENNGTWTVESAYLKGLGTKEDPYQINSTEDMEEYLNNDMYTKPDGEMAYINVSEKIDMDLLFTKNTYITGKLELTCLEPFIDIKEGTSVVFDCPVDAMFIYSYGELTIKDNVNCVVLDADTNGRLTIDSGEISSDFIYADNGGTLIVNGGDIGYGVYARKSAINGGTFSCSECRFVRSQIIGGTFSGDKCDFTNSYIKGGTFTGSDCIFNKTNITGGTFNFDPSKNGNIIIPDGYYSADNGDGTWTVKEVTANYNVSELDIMLVKAGTQYTNDTDNDVLFCYIENAVETQTTLKPGETAVINKDGESFPYNETTKDTGETVRYFYVHAFSDYTFKKDGNVYKSGNTGHLDTISKIDLEMEKDCTIKWRSSCDPYYCTMSVYVNGEYYFSSYDEYNGIFDLKAGDKLTVTYSKGSEVEFGDDCAEFEICDPIELTKVDAKDPTCDEAGNDEYYTDADGNYYVDCDDGLFVQFDAGEEVIPAAHTYGEPEWTWDEDNNATATFECEKGDSVETVEAEVTSKTENGKTVYTATVEFEGKTYTNTKEVTIPKPASAVKLEYKPGDNSVALSWDKFEGAEKYAVCGYMSGKWQLIKEVTDNGTIVRGLTAGNEYKMAVIPMVNGEWVMNFKNAITVTPNPPADLPELNVEVKNNRFVLNWTAIKGAEQYGIAVKIAGKWKVQKVVDADVTTFTSPKLNKGTYEMVVCAKINGKWDIRNIADRAVTGTIG